MESLDPNNFDESFKGWQKDLPEPRTETLEEHTQNYFAGRALGHALRATLSDAPDSIVEDVRNRLNQIRANATNPGAMGAQMCIPDLVLLHPGIAEGITDGFTDPRPEKPVSELGRFLRKDQG